MSKRRIQALLLLPFLMSWSLYAATYQVGPTRGFTTLQEVTGLLNPGDRVEVDGDHTYPGGVIFDRPGTPSAKIHIAGIRLNGKRPVISGGGDAVAFTTPWPYDVAEGGHHYIFEGFEVANATVRGIFHQARDLTVRDCLVHHCPHGILGADQGSGSLLVEYTEVRECGLGSSRHQIYMATDEINNPGSVFRLQHCYIHDGHGGNNVKTRAERNEIYYNWIEGAYYHELELIGPDYDADGGNPGLQREDSDVVGNVLIKKQTAAGNDPNFYVTRIGGDGTGESSGRYRFLNNTFISGTRAVFRMFDALEAVELQNNVFAVPQGEGAIKRTLEANWVSGQEVISGKNNWIKTGTLEIPAQLSGTLLGDDPGFVNAGQGNFYPSGISSLVNAGTLPTISPPGFEFPTPLPSPLELPPDGAVEGPGSALERKTVGTIDIGAFEYPALSTDAASLHVVIEPDRARVAGARWRRLGTTTWRASGDTETAVPPGHHAIEFAPIAGWSPPPRPRFIGDGQPLPTLTGHYSQEFGALWHVDDDNTGGIQDGTPQHPYASVQTAVASAANGDTIKVAVGDYGGIDTQGKGLTLLGGYPGATTAAYAANLGGDFEQRALDPSATTISGGAAQPGILFTRFNDDPYHGAVDNLRVSQSQKGILCDQTYSWPHPDNLFVTNSLVENNGRIDDTSRGGGILVCGVNMKIANSVIRNNHGGRGAGIFGGAANLVVQESRVEDNICYDDHGGGLFLAGTVHLNRNLIAGNRIALGYGWGGGLIVVNAGSTAWLESNIIHDNYAPTYGGAVFIDEGAIAHLSHDLIHHNRTNEKIGGGIAVDDGEPGPGAAYMDHCTIAYNNPDFVDDGYLRGGNGVFVDSHSSATVTNSIFWGNGDDFYVRDSSALTVGYSLTGEAWAGIGNRSADPLFADPEHGDFHLQSTTGRYDPATGQWIADSLHSPAIDAGDPASPFDQEQPPNGSRVNLGVFGNTAEASHSTSGTCQVGALTIASTDFGPGVSTLASEHSIATQGPVQLLSGADLTLRAPLLRFGPGLRVATGATLKAHAEAITCTPL